MCGVRYRLEFTYCMWVSSCSVLFVERLSVLHSVAFVPLLKTGHISPEVR